ncbi:MAG: SDR family NAD(P)-dependent oxidoreductase [Myxococcales bacterium]|nr:SDR family NAD(P)-dependent oxidoreductase [Myxococcales bacterium]
MASDASVAQARQQLAAQAPGEEHPLYAVVNNAGIGIGMSDLRAVLEVNTLGMRRVCEAFVPLLQPAGGRVVNVTSASGPSYVATCSPERQRQLTNPAVTADELQALIDECLALRGVEAFEAAGLGNGSPYGLSKALANAYTLLLAREHPSLRINACTPGFIQTDLTRSYVASSGRSADQLGMKPPAAGARCPMFLLFGEPEGNGRYYGSDALRSPLDRYRAPGSAPYTGEP